MLVLARSLAFSVLFFLVMFVYCIIAVPTMAMPRYGILKIAKWWSQTNLWLLDKVCGLRCQFRGVENIPPGPLLVASKHQSAWETFALVLHFSDPAFIAKRELFWLPFFGWYLWRAEMISVDRSAGGQALKALSVSAREALAEGRQILIFPEGTRTPAGAQPRYKYGVAHLYEETGATCLPVALNSGLFWPRRSLLRLPGTIIVEFLDPIRPGLDREAFLFKLRDSIEDATARLIAQGRRELKARGIEDVTMTAPR